MKVAVVVPVSPFESEEVVKASIEHLKQLDYDDFDVKFVYVIDSDSDPDYRVELAKSYGVVALHRKDRRGKRGGAINDALDYLRNFRPDYIAIFDVDSRPERNFVVECVKALESCGRCYIASSKRYIANGLNLVSETVEAEYFLINFLLSKSGFKQFNGLIGVLRADVLMAERLNEDAITEDADFATRMHARGMKGVLVRTTKLYEEAPMSWSELYSQRMRWYYGGLQLWRYRKLMRGAEFSVRISWYMALTLTYIPILFIPLLLLSPILLLYHYKRLSKLRVAAGLLAHAVLLQIASISALIRFILGRDVEWGKIRRSIE